jgi:hypothetical protein
MRWDRRLFKLQYFPRKSALSAFADHLAVLFGFVMDAQNHAAGCTSGGVVIGPTLNAGKGSDLCEYRHGHFAGTGAPG